MVYAVVILALLIARLGDVTGWRPAARAGSLAAEHPWLLPVAGALGLSAVVQLVAMHAGHRLDRAGAAGWIGRVFAIKSVALLGALACLALGVAMGGFDLWVRRIVGDAVLIDDLLIIAPVLWVLVAGWWSAYPIERRLREAMLLRHLDGGQTVHPLPSRARFVLMQVRHGLLLVLVPLMLVLTLTDVLERLPAWLGGRERSSAAAWVAEHAMILHWVGVIAMVALAPAILRRVWDVVPLGAGELRDHIGALLREQRVRVGAGGPLVWRTGGTMVNGAILGLAWPFRYLLLTDAMLERLSGAQLDAVLAHEAAHVRFHHLPWLGVVTIGSVLGTAWAMELTLLALGHTSASGATVALATLACAVIGLAVFGITSRRFEWQADAHSVRVISQRQAALYGSGEPVRAHPAAAAVVASALGAVADANGMPRHAPSWRHGSIALRQQKVLALADQDLGRLPPDRHARWLKVVGLLMLLGSLAPLGWEALR